ncbi:MAG: 6-phosphogluconolactonase [Calditrichaeota bacterium]|nr:MAG: 6-phosphogluconolactonase [Calditrichota bacterium]
MERKIQVYASLHELARAAANKIINIAYYAIQSQDRATIALAGGNTPRPVYELLATPPYCDQIQWQKIHLFWGDERAVPPDHPDSNFRMANEALLGNIPIPDENVHRIRGELEPSAAAAEYADLLRKIPGGIPPQFTLVLLGLGADGHTASLFPQTTAVEERSRNVVEVYVSKLKAWRVTLTLPVLNAASHIIFLVSGRQKAETVQKILARDPNNPDPLLPASLIQPTHGQLTWMLDREAASLL